MKITLPNGVLIEDADPNTIRALLSSFLPQTVLVEKKKSDEPPRPDYTDSAEDAKTHPLAADHTPLPNYDPLPAVCQKLGGAHRKVKTELLLILLELRMAGRSLKPAELYRRLARFEVFAKLKMQVIHHAIAILSQYGAVYQPDADHRYAIAPEVDARSEEDLLALIELHDTSAEWAGIKR